MLVEKRDDTLWADIMWDDLTAEAQSKLTELMGDNGNFDIYPLASINVTKEVD